jgi:hypothetical protein
MEARYVADAGSIRFTRRIVAAVRRAFSAIGHRGLAEQKILIFGTADLIPWLDDVVVFMGNHDAYRLGRSTPAPLSHASRHSQQAGSGDSSVVRRLSAGPVSDDPPSHTGRSPYTRAAQGRVVAPRQRHPARNRKGTGVFESNRNTVVVSGRNVVSRAQGNVA